MNKVVKNTAIELEDRCIFVTEDAERLASYINYHGNKNIKFVPVTLVCRDSAKNEFYTEEIFINVDKIIKIEKWIDEKAIDTEVKENEKKY